MLSVISFLCQFGRFASLTVSFLVTSTEGSNKQLLVLPVGLQLPGLPVAFLLGHHRTYMRPPCAGGSDVQPCRGSIESLPASAVQQTSLALRDLRALVGHISSPSWLVVILAVLNVLGVKLIEVKEALANNSPLLSFQPHSDKTLKGTLELHRFLVIIPIADSWDSVLARNRLKLR